MSTNTEIIPLKNACNGKFECLAPFVGELTFGDVRMTLSTPGSSLSELVESVFPKEHKMTGYVFLNIIRSGKVSVKPPTDAAELNYTGMVESKTVTVAQICTDLKTNAKTLQAMSVANNNLSQEDTQAILYALVDAIPEGQLAVANFSGNNSKFSVEMLQNLAIRMVASTGRIVVSKAQIDRAPADYSLHVELSVV